MSEFRIAVVEDEPIVAMDIIANLQNLGYETLGPFERAEEIIKQMKFDPPDLVLMDIKIAGEMDGIETAEILNSIAQMPLIFITASSDKQTMGRAQKVRPHAYIIKPFNFHNLHSAIELALYNYCHFNGEEGLSKYEEIPETDGYPAPQILYVRKTNSKRFEKLLLENVIMLEASGSYTNIITLDKKLTISVNLQKILAKISAKQIVRIHRSYAINIAHIQSISDDEVTVANVNVPISTSYKSSLFEQLKLL